MTKENELNKEKAPHILNTSSNLLGFSLVALTSFKSLGIPNIAFELRMGAVCVFCFAISSLLSYASIQAKYVRKSEKLELVADFVFFAGQIMLTIMALYIAFNLF